MGRPLYPSGEPSADPPGRTVPAALYEAKERECERLREALRDIRDYEESSPQDPSDVYEHFQAVARAALAREERPEYEVVDAPDGQPVIVQKREEQP